MTRRKSNDGTVRDSIWRRYEGDDWVLSGLGPGSAIWLEKSPSHKVCALTR